MNKIIKKCFKNGIKKYKYRKKTHLIVDILWPSIPVSAVYRQEASRMRLSHSYVCFELHAGEQCEIVLQIRLYRNFIIMF